MAPRTDGPAGNGEFGKGRQRVLDCGGKQGYLLDEDDLRGVADRRTVAVVKMLGQYGLAVHADNATAAIHHLQEATLLLEGRDDTGLDQSVSAVQLALMFVDYAWLIGEVIRSLGDFECRMGNDATPLACDLDRIYAEWIVQEEQDQGSYLRQALDDAGPSSDISPETIAMLRGQLVRLDARPVSRQQRRAAERASSKKAKVA